MQFLKLYFQQEAVKIFLFTLISGVGFLALCYLISFVISVDYWHVLLISASFHAIETRIMLSRK